MTRNVLKKGVAVLLTLCLLTACLPAAALFFAEADAGDVTESEIKTKSVDLDAVDLDGDKQFTINDVSRLLQKLENDAVTVHATGDANADDQINVADVTAMIILLAGGVVPTEPSEPETARIALKFNKNQVYATGHPESGRAQGTAVSYSAWVSTDFIDVSSYAALKYELAGHRYLYSVAFFDGNKRFMEGVATDSIIGYTILQGHTAIPEGAKYARFSNFTGSGEYTHTDPDVFVEGFPTAADYEIYKKSLKHDGLKIVCIGDSLTEGDHGLYPGAANKHYLNYPYFLSKILGCETVNNGRCGYTASGYYPLVSGGSVNVSDADVVLIMLGTNGGLSTGGNTAQLTAYKQLVTAVREKAPADCAVVLMTPPHATTDHDRSNYGYAPNVENAVKEVRAYAADRGLPLIDVYAESPIQADKEDLYQPVDGLHLNAEGYKALASFIAEKLEAILAAK